MKETKLYVLSHGFMETDKSWEVFNPASIKDPNRPAVWTRTPVLTFLIVHPDVTVLFDTGCNAEGMLRRASAIKDLIPFHGTEDEKMERRLAGLGLSPQDIDVVVMSHLHYDHAGNLGLFTKSKILVHAAELAHALLMTRLKGNLGYSRHDFDIEGLRWELVEEDSKIAPGLEVITLEGHTPGLLGLVVHLKETGTVICPGDAISTRNNYGPPAQMTPGIYDSLGFTRTVKKVRRLQEEYHAKLFYSHDMEQYEKEMLKPPQFYV